MSSANTTQKLRLIKAVTIVLVAFLALPAIGSALEATGETQAVHAPPVGIDSKRLIGSADAATVLEELEREARPATTADAVPDEIEIPDEARDLRVSSDGTVMSFVMDCGQGEAFARFEACMREGGWRAVPLSGVTGATFVKNSGREGSGWALATCTEVGRSTTVVVRC